MKCEETRRALVNYMNDAIEDKEKFVVELHLDSCKACKKELEALRLVQKEFRVAMNEIVSDDFIPETVKWKIKKQLAPKWYDYKTKGTVVEKSVLNTVQCLINVFTKMAVWQRSLSVFILLVLISVPILILILLPPTLSWNPQGFSQKEKILCQLVQDPDSRIFTPEYYIMSPNGSTMINLNTILTEKHFAINYEIKRIETRWIELSPDGSKILINAVAYGNYRAPLDDSLFVLDFDGSITKVVSFSDPSSLNHSSCFWSPDGKITMVTVTYNGYSNTIEIFTMNTDGATKNKIFSDQTSSFSFLLSPTYHRWSPDGSKLAFDLNNFVYVIGKDGAFLKKIGTGNETNTFICWSPDNNKLVYSTFLSSVGNGLFIQSLENDKTSTLMENIGSASSPSSSTALWSPNGNKLLFEKDGSYYLADKSGENIRKFADNFLSDFTPYWSPDGSKIAFHNNKTKELYITDDDGSNPTLLTDSAIINMLWSPDSKIIAYISAERSMYIIDITTKEIKKITGEKIIIYSLMQWVSVNRN